jgi:hypothetical protein
MFILWHSSPSWNHRGRERSVRFVIPSLFANRLVVLVLDIDYTLFDHRSVVGNPLESMRPFLHEFLATAYEYYDIAIWSATGMKWVALKMKELGVTGHQDYKIRYPH